MGYLSKGYYTICLSSVLSSISFLILLLFFVESEVEQTLFLALNISILGIQACGIVLCGVGYRKHETIESLFGYKKKDTLSFDMSLSVVLTVLLILWGSFIVYLTSHYVYFSQPYEKLMLMRKTVEFVAYVAWALKGIIGIVSGLIFTVKLLLRKPKTEISSP